MRLSALLAVSAVTLMATQASAADQAPTLTNVYNAVGGAENGGDSFSSGGPVLVDQILTGSDAAALYSITLNLSVSKPDLGSFDVILTGVSAKGLPINSVVVATVSDKNLTSSFALMQVKPALMINLAANTRYYVGIHKASGGMSHVILGNTVDPTVLARKNVQAGGLYYNNGGVQANSGGPYEIKVVATP